MQPDSSRDKRALLVRGGPAPCIGPRCSKGAERLSALRHALLAALVFGLPGAGMAWPRGAGTTLEPIVGQPNQDPNERCTLDGMYSPVKYESFLVEANYGFDLRLMLSADGSGVPTSEKNLVIVGINKYGLLHIRTFDASGHRTDTDEANLSSTQVGTISTLKQRIKGLLPPRRLTVDESHQLISQVKSFVGLAHQDYFVRELMEAVAKVVHKDTGYEVTRVTSPPGYGKSALLRYLEQILYCDPRVQGSRPNRIREVLRCDERDFHIRDHFCSIKLDQLTSQFEVRSIMLDDLKNEDGFEAAAFNKLPAFDYDDHS